jgi:septal ring factor EnvC (AmiA/AmiB activator)
MRLNPAIALLAALMLGHPVIAQDVPGIENCMAEKQIERRTGCLQSNINFLKTTIATEVAKARSEAQAKVEEARKQIDSLKLQVSGLQDQVSQLQAAADDAKRKADAAKGDNKPAAK